MNRSLRLPADDEGFSLLETIVALGIVGVVMASAIVFFVGSQASMRRQADSQAAVQLAAGAMDYVSQLTGKNVLLGRTETDVRSQRKVPGVGVYFDDEQHRTLLAFQDESDPTTSTLQTLPTTAESITVSGISIPYERWWYVGRCWQAKGGGDCAVPAVVPPDAIAMFRVVVAITWPSPQCLADECQYVTAMLTEVDPVDPTWK